MCIGTCTNTAPNSINEIVSRCGFQGATYSASDSNAANGVVVAATRPTNANQLTTTITGGTGAVGPAPTGTGSGAVTSAGTFTTTGTVTSGSSTFTTTGTTTATTGTGAAATGTGVTVAGAPGLEPLGGGMKVFLTVVGAGVLGFWMH